MLGVSWLAGRLGCSVGTASTLIKAMVRNGTIEVVHDNYSAASGRARVYKAGWKLLKCVSEAGLDLDTGARKETAASSTHDPRADYTLDSTQDHLLKDVRVLTSAGYEADYIVEIIWDKLRRFERMYGSLPRGRRNVEQVVKLWHRKVHGSAA